MQGYAQLAVNARQISSPPRSRPSHRTSGTRTDGPRDPARTRRARTRPSRRRAGDGERRRVMWCMGLPPLAGWLTVGRTQAGRASGDLRAGPVAATRSGAASRAATSWPMARHAVWRALGWCSQVASMSFVSWLACCGSSGDRSDRGAQRRHGVGAGRQHADRRAVGSARAAPSLRGRRPRARRPDRAAGRRPGTRAASARGRRLPGRLRRGRRTASARVRAGRASSALRPRRGRSGRRGRRAPRAPPGGSSRWGRPSARRCTRRRAGARPRSESSSAGAAQPRSTHPSLQPRS